MLSFRCVFYSAKKKKSIGFFIQITSCWFNTNSPLLHRTYWHIERMRKRSSSIYKNNHCKTTLSSFRKNDIDDDTMEFNDHHGFWIVHCCCLWTIVEWYKWRVSFMFLWFWMMLCRFNGECHGIDRFTETICVFWSISSTTFSSWDSIENLHIQSWYWFDNSINPSIRSSRCSHRTNHVNRFERNAQSRCW